MTLDQLVGQLEDQAKEIMKGARALAERLEEKKKEGTVSKADEEQWHDAVCANVKKAEELRQDVANLLTL